ncbi:hypothetical protein BLS_006639 [Venturia inaequalis]|nr:hypothetical protein BLS_006639 [Venturia inaequalis]
MDASSLNWLGERSTPQYTCTVDRHGQRRCVKKASFFHRVGKFILIAMLIFFAIVTLLCVCCCLKMRKKKSKNVDPNAPPQSGFMGMFGKKKQQNQQYNLETAQPGGFYGQPPPQAHLAGH